MPRLALYLLGPPTFELDGQPVHVSRYKAVALLAYLAVTGQSHRRDSLAALLWPECDHRRARADVRRTLSVLNRTLGSGRLQVDRETAGLNWDADLWLDVVEFQARLAEPWKHDHPADQTCPDCLNALAGAVALYRDDFLAGFTLRDSPAFDDWQFFQTQALREGLAGALERLARGHGEQSEFEPAIAYARRWAALDPLHEPAHRLLMQLYAGSGQRAAALRQYAECERVLAEELGLPPEEATTLVFQTIKEGRGLSPAEKPPALAPAPQGVARRHNLPLQLTPFVGREDLLAGVAERLGDPACRLLTLVGPGGSGKTRLALEAGAAQLDRFPDGVFFAPLVALDSTEAIVPTVAQGVGCSFQRGQEPQPQLLDYLRPKALLLILDNYEHLLGGVGLVGEILRAAPGVKVLVTSRTRLNVEGEYLYQMPGMAFPGQGNLQDALQYDAVKLFREGARRTRPGFELRDDNVGDVVQICRLVQGLPLGLLLAAAWVGMLTPAEIAAEIGESLDFLETDLSDVPERLRSMRAVFDHSWHFLADREREVMRALSVFRGDFTRQAAERVAGATLRQLKGLADKSMLQRVPVPAGPLSAHRRYEVHELLRQYAAEKLAQRPDAWERARDRHSAYYTTALQRWRQDLKGGRQQRRALAEIEADIENARAAWNWAVERRQAARLARAVEGLCWYYNWSNRSEELESVCRAAVDGLTPPESGEEQRVLAQVLGWQGMFLPLEQEVRLVEQSFALLEDLESAGQEVRHEKAFALRRLGDSAQNLGHLEGSERLLQQSLALYRALGDPAGAAEALEGLAEWGRFLGAPALVERYSEESLTIRQSLDDGVGMVRSLTMLGWAAMLQGQLEEAMRLHRQGLATRREIQLNRNDEYELLLALGITLSGLGRFTEARTQLEMSLAIAAESALLSTWSNLFLGLVALHLGRYEAARASGQAALKTARALDHRPGLGFSHLLLGCAALARTGDEEALALLTKSVALYRGTGQRLGRPMALGVLGLALAGQGDGLEASQALSHALRRVADTGNLMSLGWVIPGIVALLLDRGQTELAVEVYAMASAHYPMVRQSRWFQELIGCHVAKTEAGLPPVVVEAAQVRGQARDPQATVAELLAAL